MEQKKNTEGYRAQYLKKVLSESKAIDKNAAFNNYFSVVFPEEMQIRAHDVVSIEFLKENKCRFTIINNYTNHPLIAINRFKNEGEKLFKRRQKNIKIVYVNKMGVIKMESILFGVKIVNIEEEKLSYMDDTPQKIVFDVEYKYRILQEKNGATDKE